MNYNPTIKQNEGTIPERKPRLLWLATGGTIASSLGPDGLEPELTYEEMARFLPPSSIHAEITCREILRLDSSNIQPEDWVLMAREIVPAKDDFDGIIITHGTDTLAYTASILSFMLQDFPLPVVITGSQLPITDPLTDAVYNLATAFAMASSGIPGVYVAFDREVIFGTRAVKTKTLDFAAFESINALPVGYVNADGLLIEPSYREVLEEKRRTAWNQPFQLKDAIDASVFLIKLVPGLDPKIFSLLKTAGYRGLVIEAFGIGGLHYLYRDQVSALGELMDSGVPVVVTSQCLYERSDFSIYATGKKLLDRGAIPAFDMTTESAVTKLMWALGQTQDTKGIQRMFQHSLAWEISLPRVVAVDV